MLLCNKYYANQHHHRPSTPMPFDDLLCFKIMSLNKQIKFNTMNSLLHCIKFDQCENYFSSLHGIFDFIVLLCSISFCAPLVPSLIRCGSLPCMLVHFFFFYPSDEGKKTASLSFYTIDIAFQTNFEWHTKHDN